MKRSIGMSLAALVLGASVVACGGGQPAVCSSVDDLKSSVDSVKNVDLRSSNGISDLENAISKVKSALGDVKTNAKSEFSSEIAGVEKNYAALKTSADAAKADPSATTLATAKSALSSFVASAQTLVTKVQSTC